MQSNPFPRRILASLLLTCFASTLTLPVQAQVSSGSLYYRLGGNGPGGRATNKNQLTAQLGIKDVLRYNYSCGKFDIGLSWTNVMNGINRLGQTVSGAVQAGISALPLYVLQRAQPGLYQLYQNYSAKADAMVAASMRTCEEMETMIAQGKDPYQDFVTISKSASWKSKTQQGGDAVQAKLDITKNEEHLSNGVNWVFGQTAGGIGKAPLRPMRDLSVAGYNATINRATNTASNTQYASATEKSTRLVQAFKSPDELAAFTTQVLGDSQIYLCSGMSNCPSTSSTATASGLGPRLDAEFDFVAPRLTSMVNAQSPSYADMAAVAAPGMTVTPQLLDSVRKLPPDTRALALNRLAHELAILRVVDKALVARNVLLTALSLPEAVAAADVSRDVHAKLDRLTRYIEDMMYEFRIRKEMTGESALAILDEAANRSGQALRVPGGVPSEPNPLVNGRVTSP